MITGTTVTLYTKTLTGYDPFGGPIYEETPETVDDVLIGEPSTGEIRDVLELTGKTLAYTLAIPKGDDHDWTNARIDFWGQSFQAIGYPTQGIEENIPLRWNRKVRVMHRE